MSKLSRRRFLKGLASGTGAAALTTVSPFALTARPAFAASPTGKRLLVVNFAGGYDHIYMAQPNAAGTMQDNIQNIRPTLWRDPAGLLNVGDVGLSPSLTEFANQFGAGNLAIVHKVWYEDASRSHDQAEDAWARGVTDINNNTNSGWLQRLGGVNLSQELFGAFDLTGGHETFGGGGYTPVTLNRLSDFGFDDNGNNEFDRRIGTVYSLQGEYEAKGPSGNALKTSWPVIENSVDAINSALNNSPPNPYPNTNWGRRFRDAGTVFTELGATVAYIRRGGFDNHSNQDNAMEGGGNGLLPRFNAALQVFIANMQAAGLWNDTVIMVVSEFSRTLDENGNQGTDHGEAIDMYLIGPSVNGGIYGGSYTPSDFVQGSGRLFLKGTVNMVDVYREVVSTLGYDPNAIFENGYAGQQALGLF